MPLVTPLGIRIMNDVLSTFEEDGVIRVQGFLGREAIKRHGEGNNLPYSITYAERPAKLLLAAHVLGSERAIKMLEIGRKAPKNRGC